jgi:hypothetical protein
MTGPLVMKEGTITIGGVLSAGSLSMTGGTISSPGTGLLALSGNVQATSSPSGPATVASGVQLKASPTVTVAPGTAPELRVTGAISETGGSRSIRKRAKGNAKGSVLVKVTKVVFAINGKTVKTTRSAPFRARLIVPSTVTSGGTIKLRVKSYLKIRGGGRRSKSITVAVKVC